MADSGWGAVCRAFSALIGVHGLCAQFSLLSTLQLPFGYVALLSQWNHGKLPFVKKIRFETLKSFSHRLGQMHEKGQLFLITAWSDHCHAVYPRAQFLSCAYSIPRASTWGHRLLPPRHAEKLLEAWGELNRKETNALRQSPIQGSTNSLWLSNSFPGHLRWVFTLICLISTLAFLPKLFLVCVPASLRTAIC